MVIASCNVSGSDSNIIFAGSARLALLGNVLKDAQKSHVVRIWQANRSVISDNIISGSSLTNNQGRLALKLHSPDRGGGDVGTPTANTGITNIETEYSIVSDNVFGSSGPFPVCIGPENTTVDERISNIIFERNRIHSDYGSQSIILPVASLHIWGRYCTVRNNIIDGTGSQPGYNGIVVEREGTVVPAPTNIEVYNNTIYRGDSSSDIHRGIRVGPEVTNSIVRNNLISFPYATGSVVMILNETTDLVYSNNILTSTAGFVLPNAVNPLNRDFRLQAGSPAQNQGINVPVYEDYFNNTRPVSLSDVGAFEQ